MPIHPFLLKIRRKKAIAIVPICVLVLLIGLALVLLAELIYRAVRHFCGVEKHV